MTSGVPGPAPPPPTGSLPALPLMPLPPVPALLPPMPLPAPPAIGDPAPAPPPPPLPLLELPAAAPVFAPATGSNTASPLPEHANTNPDRPSTPKTDFISDTVLNNTFDPVNVGRRMVPSSGGIAAINPPSPTLRLFEFEMGRR